jgi:hypothetical protein
MSTSCKKFYNNVFDMNRSFLCVQKGGETLQLRVNFSNYFATGLEVD